MPQLEDERACYKGAERFARAKHGKLADSVDQTAAAIRKLRKIR